MQCKYANICGGCAFEVSDEEKYRADKLASFKQILGKLNQKEIPLGKPIWVPIKSRRRTSFSFSYSAKKLIIGYNERRTNNIVDIDDCPLLTEKIVKNLSNIKEILTEICITPIQTVKNKKKVITSYVRTGNLFVTEADNGLDILIETEEKLSLDHLMIVAEKANMMDDIVRVSSRKDMFSVTETILEKIKPIIKIADKNIYIAAGTFLQASNFGEQALIGKVLEYVGKDKGSILDLFCGIGTFSYPLSLNGKNKILAADFSESLLAGFQESINKNMISNIEIMQKNLFKYPFDVKELKDVDIVIIDPPRKGAKAQFEMIANAFSTSKLKKVIAVSCNPHSFVTDANLLCEAGYKIKEITLVDQFTYSSHFELVALFGKLG